MLTQDFIGIVVLVGLCCCSVAQWCPALCDPMDCSTPGLPVLHHLPELVQTHVHWVGDAIPTISSSVVPFSCLKYFSTSRSSPVSQFFTSGGQSMGVSASASVLPMNIQDWFSLGLLVWPPCSPRDSPELSPIPRFKSINSLALIFPYSPMFTSIHDYWKNCSFN